MKKTAKTTVYTFSNLVLKILTEGAVRTATGSLFQYFTTLTEKATPLLRRWLLHWGTFYGVPSKTQTSGEKTVRISLQEAR